MSNFWINYDEMDRLTDHMTCEELGMLFERVIACFRSGKQMKDDPELIPYKSMFSFSDPYEIPIDVNGFLLGKRVAHIWNGYDTACRMYSTGGITRKKRYHVSETNPGLPICGVCKTHMERRG